MQSSFCASINKDSNQPARSGMSWFWNIIYIVYSLEVGAVLLSLPRLRFWENNYLLYVYPQIRPIVTNAYFKGAVIGLGIVNILIGIQEIVHFKKNFKIYFSR
jgi:hypothetical protein